MKTCLPVATAMMVLGCTLWASPLAAQTTASTLPAFATFERWVHGVAPAVADAPAAAVHTLPLALTGPTTAERYQPAPIILGLPDLPLVFQGSTPPGRDWSPLLNYMGLQVRQIVLDAPGQRQVSRSMVQGPRPGERFKLRVTASFDAVAEVDQVVGEVWYGQRTGQLYPQPGLSVEIRAGQTVDLPLAPNEYFVMPAPSQERLLLKVRHPRALREARSDQPVYRQDSAVASSYLQLVPRGTFPAFEQLVLPTP